MHLYLYLYLYFCLYFAIDYPKERDGESNCKEEGYHQASEDDSFPSKSWQLNVLLGLTNGIFLLEQAKNSLDLMKAIIS